MSTLNLDQIINDFAKDLLNILLGHMEASYISASGKSFKGLNNKSTLYNSTTVIVDSTPSIKIDTQDYFKYFNGGRKPGAKKVPIKVILLWIKRKNIRPRNSKGQFKSMTLNQLAYAIQQSIFKIGIRPRNIVQKTLRDIDTLYKNNLEPEIGKLIDSLFDQFNLNTIRDSKATFNVKPKKIK